MTLVNRIIQVSSVRPRRGDNQSSQQRIGKEDGCMYTLECYSAIRKEEVPPFVTPSTSLENIPVSWSIHLWTDTWAVCIPWLLWILPAALCSPWRVLGLHWELWATGPSRSHATECNRHNLYILELKVKKRNVLSWAMKEKRENTGKNIRTKWDKQYAHWPQTSPEMIVSASGNLFHSAEVWAKVGHVVVC